MSDFYAFLSRMKLIQRWSLMRNSTTENIQEHSLQVALIAHGLVTIRNEVFQGNLSADRVTALAIFHDASEVITGDLPTPVKYFNPEIKKAYNDIEDVARQRLFNMLPGNLQQAFLPYLFQQPEDEEYWKIVKAADKICAYLKCVEELRTGNEEFISAEKSIKRELEEYNLPEVKFFLSQFVPSFSLTLDELNK
ncbi:MAG TPA: 5'-deoxynucleotidase [Bacillota bacterium]|nr:5'-deoxynucleotidase [Bacillota bacterium]